MLCPSSGQSPAQSIEISSTGTLGAPQFGLVRDFGLTGLEGKLFPAAASAEVREDAGYRTALRHSLGRIPGRAL